MRAAHGSLVSFFLLIPILAIPFFAVFGVPEFTPRVKSPLGVSAEPTADRDDAPHFKAAPSVEDQEFQQAARQQAASEWQDLPAEPKLAPLENRRLSSRSRTSAGEATAPSPFHMQSGEETQQASWEQDPPVRQPRRVASNATSDPSAGTDVILGDASPELGGRAAQGQVRPAMDSKPTSGQLGIVAQGLTWKTAVQRLNDLEIRNFRLEPGQQEQQFLFVCSYTPHDSPRISYRFEAEADEPLRAVEKVLAQIDSWLAAR